MYPFMKSPEDFKKFLTNGTGSEPDDDMVKALYKMIIIENVNPHPIKTAYNTGFFANREEIDQNLTEEELNEYGVIEKAINYIEKFCEKTPEGGRDECMKQLVERDFDRVFPNYLQEKIDELRGDMSRSEYLLSKNNSTEITLIEPADCLPCLNSDIYSEIGADN